MSNSYSRYAKILDRQSYYKSRPGTTENGGHKGFKKEKHLKQYTDTQNDKPSGTIEEKQIKPSSFFQSVSRDKTRGFFRYNLPEKSYNSYYKPKFECTQPRNPSYSIQKSKQERSITAFPANREIYKDQHNMNFSVCSKHPLVRTRAKNLSEHDNLARNINNVVTEIDDNLETQQSEMLADQDNHQQKQSNQNVSSSNNNNNDTSQENQNQKSKRIKELRQQKLQLSALNLNELERKERFLLKEISKKKQKKWIQLEKSNLPRFTYLKSENTENYDDEKRFQNFSLTVFNFEKSHSFLSYVKRDVKVQKPQPAYDLLNVNYDRIYPKLKGVLNFGVQKPRADLLPQTPGTQLSYFNVDNNYKKNCTKRIPQVEIDRYSPRKLNMFSINTIDQHRPKIENSSTLYQKSQIKQNSFLNNNQTTIAYDIVKKINQTQSLMKPYHNQHSRSLTPNYK